MKKPLIIIAISFILVLSALAGYLNYAARRLPSNTPARYLAAPEREKDKKIIVCAGDSITHSSVSCNYPDMLAERLPTGRYTVINAGVNSEFAWNLLGRIDEIIACKPSVVTVLIGTNDVNSTLSREKERSYIKEMHLPRKPDREWYRSNLDAVCARLKSAGVPHIALLSLPPMGEDPSHAAFRRAAEYRGIIKSTAAAHGISYLPLGEKMEEFLGQHPHRPLYPYEKGEFLLYIAIIKYYALFQPWDDIARANGHLLLTDMLHLDCTAAAMTAELIERFIAGSPGCAVK
jgi:acyl-CoA thioesterase I